MAPNPFLLGALQRVNDKSFERERMDAQARLTDQQNAAQMSSQVPQVFHTITGLLNDRESREDARSRLMQELAGKYQVSMYEQEQHNQRAAQEHADKLAQRMAELQWRGDQTAANVYRTDKDYDWHMADIASRNRAQKDAAQARLAEQQRRATLARQHAASKNAAAEWQAKYVAEMGRVRTLEMKGSDLGGTMMGAMPTQYEEAKKAAKEAWDQWHKHMNDAATAALEAGSSGSTVSESSYSSTSASMGESVKPWE